MPTRTPPPRSRRRRHRRYCRCRRRHDGRRPASPAEEVGRTGSSRPTTRQQADQQQAQQAAYEQGQQSKSSRISKPSRWPRCRQQLETMQAQQAAAAAAAPAAESAAPAGAGDDMMAQLNQLAQLHASGVLDRRRVRGCEGQAARLGRRVCLTTVGSQKIQPPGIEPGGFPRRERDADDEHRSPHRSGRVGPATGQRRGPALARLGGLHPGHLDPERAQPDAGRRRAQPAPRPSLRDHGRAPDLHLPARPHTAAGRGQGPAALPGQGLRLGRRHRRLPGAEQRAGAAHRPHGPGHAATGWASQRVQGLLLQPRRRWSALGPARGHPRARVRRPGRWSRSRTRRPMPTFTPPRMPCGTCWSRCRPSAMAITTR